MQKETSRRLLPLKNDLLFQKIFGDKNNNDILRAFLSSALEFPTEEFSELTIYDPRLERNFSEEKLGVLDVRIKQNLEFSLMLKYN